MIVAYSCATIAVVMAIAADYFIKVASVRDMPLLTWSFVLGAMLYVVSTVGWVYAMKGMSLAQVGVAYSVVTILALAAMGHFVFGEQTTTREMVGIGFAIVALVIMTK